MSKLHYSSTEVKDLLQSMIQAGDSLLLFTQNVTKVTVYHLANKKNPANMKELYCVDKARVKYVRHLPTCLVSSQDETIQQSSILKAVSCTMDSVRLGSGTPSEDVESSMVIQVNQKISQAGTRMWDIEKPEAAYWLVSECMGSKEAFDLARSDPKLVPVGGVAVPLQKTASGWKPVVDESFEGHVFCFLPLPILSDLPVHINGYFCVTSSRRHLYEPDWKDKTDPRAVWNNALLKDPVQKAYTNMLVDLTKVSPSCGHPSMSCGLVLEKGFSLH